MLYYVKADEDGYLALFKVDMSRKGRKKKED